MSIDFGTVKEYFPSRGFGFVEHTLKDGYKGDVFFNIATIKKSDPGLANLISSLFANSTVMPARRSRTCATLFEASKPEPREHIRFWFDFNDTPKGKQITNVLDVDCVYKRITSSSNIIVIKIESRWADIHTTLPDWIQEVTVAALGPDRATELAKERDDLEKEQNEIEGIRRSEFEARNCHVQADTHGRLEECRTQEQIEEDEFVQLVAEMRSKGVKRSAEVSSYIVSNRLGHKYRNISGILEMQNDERTWPFEGGFPPKIYAKLCNELGLVNEGTRAKPGEFTPYSALLK